MPGGRKEAVVVLVHLHHQAAVIYTYWNFQDTIFKYQLLFTISDMIILNPKQFPGLSVSYLYSSKFHPDN